MSEPQTGRVALTTGGLAAILASTYCLTVDGVTNVEASFEKREAVVTFDRARGNVQESTNATEDAGYPSSIKE